MADVTLTYKGATIAELNDSGSKTLRTAGKFCEADIALDYVKPEGITPTGTKQISISTNGTVTEDVTNFASAEITVDVRDDTTIPGGSAELGWFAGTAYQPTTWTAVEGETFRSRSEMLPAKGVRYIQVTDDTGALAAVEYIYCYNADGTKLGNATLSNVGYYGLVYGTEYIVIQLNSRFQQSPTSRKVTPIILPFPISDAHAGILYGAKLIKGISIWNNSGTETVNASSYATEFIPCYGFTTCKYAPRDRSHVHFYKEDKTSLNAGIVFQNTASFSIPEGAYYFRRSTNYERYYPVFSLSV